MEAWANPWEEMMIESGATMLTNAGHKLHKWTMGRLQQIQVNLVLQAVQLATGPPPCMFPLITIQYNFKPNQYTVIQRNAIQLVIIPLDNTMRWCHRALEYSIAMLRKVVLLQSNAGSAYPWTMVGNPRKGNALPPDKHFHTSAYFDPHRGHHREANDDAIACWETSTEAISLMHRLQ